MKGTHFLPILFTLILVSCTTGKRKTYLSRPNIIFIMADDLGYGDLGCFGAEDIKTPNIDRHHNDPFFLYIPHSMPHVPIYASEDFIGTSERELYGDVVQELDWSVGEVLKKVEEYGLTENTLIVFTSDNGPWLAMKEFGGSAGILRGGKFFTFEGGMRVPAVAMWKGVIPSGQVTSDMVSMMDWMPTIMDVTGGKPAVDKIIDGKNIMDLLSCTGKRASNSYLYIYLDELRGYQENGWKVKLPFEGFGGARWKVAVAPHDTLLFNLNTDPGEKTDLFSENPEKAWELCCRMDSAYKSLGDLPPSLIMNSPADKSHFERMKQ